MGNYHIVSLNRQCINFIKTKILKSNFVKLISAVKSGNLRMIKYFHIKNVNFNQTLQNGDTIIHIAVKSGRIGVVKFIAENVPKLDFNERNLSGDTPLMLAIMNGDIRMVEYLVMRQSVNVNLPENRGFTPFIAACANGNLNIVDFLVKHGVNFKAKAKDGQTGMHRAAFYGNREVIKYLLKDLRLSAMVPDKKGNLPLHLACMKLKFTCVRLLIKASNLPVLELLHMRNNNGAKPIEILTRNLNKLTHIDEVKAISEEQVEEYIRDKHNPPMIKKEMSPTSMRSKCKSPTAFERLKSAFTFRETTPMDLGFNQVSYFNQVDNQLDMTPNETIINLKPLDAIYCLERKDRDNLDEEILKYSRVTNETISDMSPVFPLLFTKGPSLETPSQKNQCQRSVKFSQETIQQKGRPHLHVITDLSRVSLKSNLKAGVSNPDELKSDGLIPTIKLKFSNLAKANDE